MSIKKTLLLVLVVIASCFICFSAFSQAPTAGLLAYFRFNNNMLNSGPANITAAGTSTSFATDKFGNANSALQLAGSTSSYVTFTDNGNLDFTGNFTVSFLFYFTGSAASGMIDNCLNYNGWGVWCWNVNGPWNIQFNFRNGSVGSTLTQFTANTWHHVTAVRNSGTISVYLNGALKQSATEGTQTPSYPIAPLAGAMGFASMTPPRYNPYAGRMDEIRIYNRALSASEIAGLASFTLPLQLGDFTAVKQPGRIQLNWETVTEQNTSHFEVERSQDGTDFRSIGQVSAAGNSVGKIQYSFTDHQPLPGINLYRLKMVDIDAKFTYSRVIVVKDKTGNSLVQLFPNPASDQLQVQIPAGESSSSAIRITDITGKMVYSKTLQLSAGNNTISIPVHDLPPGTYHLIVDLNDNRQSIPFLKQ